MIESNQQHNGTGDNVYGDKNVYYSAEKKVFPQFLTSSLPRLDPDALTGRTKELDDVHSLLLSSRKVVVVNGIGGIGKTTLAQAYVGKYMNEYKHIAWIASTTADFMQNVIDTTSLLDNLQINTAGKDSSGLFYQVLNTLRNIENEPCLLIIDDAEESLKKHINLLPCQPKWHILVTSRQHFQFFETFELDFLSEDDAVLLFRRHYQRDTLSADEIRKLVRIVDYHTLTIEILAKTAQIQRLEYKEMQTALRNDIETPAEVSSAGESVKVEHIMTYLCSIFALSNLTNTEIWLLKQFVCMPSDFQSFTLLEELLTTESLEKSELSQLLDTLSDKGWLIEGEDKERYKLHQILNEIIQAKETIETEDIETLLERISAKLKLDQTKDNPIDKFQWIAYGKSILSALKDENSEVACLENNLAMVLQHSGEYKEAKILLQKTLASTEKNFGTDHPSTAISYSNLALVLQDLGEYEDAKVLLQKALDIFVKKLPAGHPYIRKAQDNLKIFTDREISG